MCTNNLRQHGVAWYLYLDDHNEYFPKYVENMPSDIQCDEFSFGGKAGSALTYPANVRPLNRYLDVTDTSAEIFHCPDDTKASASAYFGYYGTSYLFNDSILIFGPDAQRPLGTITNARSKVLLEMCSPGIFPGHSGEGPVGSNTPVMVLFVDGHVKGPYLDDSEFDTTPTGDYPEKPVYQYTNTTSDEYD